MKVLDSLVRLGGAWHRLPSLAFAVLLISAATAQVQADQRVALVIGNANYPDSPLDNPLHDARAVGEVLRELGFAVVEAHDANRAKMRQAVEQVRGLLNGRRGVGMLYYAGHGVQIDWRNFLIPVDATLQSSADVRAQAVDVQEVIDAFRSAGTRVNIVVLDACRNNPFVPAGAAKGLAPMDAPPGTLLAYATAPGNLALDSNGRSAHGLYSHYLLEELRGPPAGIEAIFKRVRAQVRRDSQGRQVPWEATSLEDEFHFRSAEAASSDPGKAFALEKTEWDRIKDSRNVAMVFGFLGKYPTGFFSEQAQFKLDQLQQPMLTAQAGKDGIAPLAPGKSRWHVGDVVVYELFDNLSKETRRATLRATSAEGDRVVFNHGTVILDQMGGTIKNQFGSYDPAVMVAPADIAIGKKWRSAYQQTLEGGAKGTSYWDNKVTAIEEVRALGRAVLAYRVERSGQAQFSRGLSMLKGTLWIDPTTMQVVRSEIETRFNGKVVQSNGYVMLEYRAGP